MLRPREHPNEPLEDHLKSSLRLLGRHIGGRRLFSDNQLQFGDKVHHQLAIRAQRFFERLAPDGQLRVALYEQARTRL